MGLRITCIKKDGGNHENPYVAITSLSYVDDSTGQANSTGRTQMHDWVKSGGYAYVQAGLTRARLIAEISMRGKKYVRTEADSIQADNLLKLPECR